MINPLVSQLGAAEKQKNELERDAGRTINRPPLRGFILLTASGTYPVLQEIWVMTRVEKGADAAPGRGWERRWGCGYYKYVAPYGAADGADPVLS